MSNKYKNGYLAGFNDNYFMKSLLNNNSFKESKLLIYLMKYNNGKLKLNHKKNYFDNFLLLVLIIKIT